MSQTNREKRKKKKVRNERRRKKKKRRRRRRKKKKKKKKKSHTHLCSCGVLRRRGAAQPRRGDGVRKKLKNGVCVTIVVLVGHPTMMLRR